MQELGSALMKLLPFVIIYNPKINLIMVCVPSFSMELPSAVSDYLMDRIKTVWYICSLYKEGKKKKSDFDTVS